jgi:hypothetical protein
VVARGVRAVAAKCAALISAKILAVPSSGVVALARLPEGVVPTLTELGRVRAQPEVAARERRPPFPTPRDRRVAAASLAPGHAQQQPLHISELALVVLATHASLVVQLVLVEPQIEVLTLVRAQQTVGRGVRRVGLAEADPSKCYNAHETRATSAGATMSCGEAKGRQVGVVRGSAQRQTRGPNSRGTIDTSVCMGVYDECECTMRVMSVSVRFAGIVTQGFVCCTGCVSTYL